MGDRYEPTDLSWGNSTTFTNTTNTNFDEIATLLDSFLSRTDDTNANAMDVDLDMNSNDLLNGNDIYCNRLFIDNAQIPSLEDIQEAHASYLATLAASEAAVEANITATADAAETTINGYLTDAEAARDAAQLAETNAETAETGAVAAKDAAEAAAAGVNLPSIVGGDAGKRLQVNGTEDGYELFTPTTYEETSVALTGGYTSGTAYFARMGNLVTITLSQPSWASSSSVNTGSGFVPAAYDPDKYFSTVVVADPTGVIELSVLPDISGASLILECRDWSGATVNRTGLDGPNAVSISYYLNA